MGRRHVSARDHAARRSDQSVRDDHRGLQRLLRVLRGALYARPRAGAGQGRHPVGRAGGGCDGAEGNPAARADREPLPGAGRSRLRLRPATRRGERHPRRRANPVRESAPATYRHAPDRGGSRSAKGLQAPAPAGAVRVDANADGDAPATHPRGVSRSGGLHPRGDSRRHTVHRCDRWFSRRDGRRLR